MAVPGTPVAAINFTGTAIGSLSAGSGVTVTAGDAIVVCVYHFTGGGTVTVTDGTNTYTQAGSTLNTGGQGLSRIFVASNVAGGTFTAQANFTTNADYVGIAVVPVPDMNASPVMAASQQAQNFPGTGANGVSSTNATPTNEPFTQLAFSMNTSSVADPAPGTGFTGLGSFWGSPEILQIAYREVSGSTAATASTFTAATDAWHYTHQVLLRDAGGGGGGTAVPVFAHYLRMMKR